MTVELIGLYGGTFDPIHHGHLQVTRGLLATLPFSEIRLIPCQIPVHRDHPMASPDQRVEMITRALEDQPHLSLDTIELRANRPSYTLYTLQALRQHLTQPLAFILGEDAFAQFHTWKDWQQIMKHTHLVVVNRPDTPPPQHPALLRLLDQHETQDPAALLTEETGLIYRSAVETLAISASDIRTRLRHKQDISTLVPAPVMHYILANQLYYEPQ